MITERIGRATLYLADCREVLPGLDVDTVITSPPYNCGMDYGTASDDLGIDDYKRLLRDTLFGLRPNRICVNIGNYIGSRTARVRTADVMREIGGGARATGRDHLGQRPREQRRLGTLSTQPAHPSTARDDLHLRNRSDARR